MVSAVLLNEGSANDGWDSGYGESGYDGSAIPKLTSDQLPDFYRRVISELRADGHEQFLVRLSDALEGDGDPYWSLEGQRFDLRHVQHPASDGSNILHSLVEAVHRSRLEGARAGLLTQVLVDNYPDLFFQEAEVPKKLDDWTPKAGKNPLEFASLYPDCIDIVKAICEYGIVEEMTREEKEEMERKLQEDILKNLGTPTPTTPDSGVAMSRSVPAPQSFGQVTRQLFAPFLPTAMNTRGGNQPIAGGSQEALSMPDSVPDRIKEAQDDLADNFVEVAHENRYVYRHVFWKELIRDNHDSCLHLAVGAGNNACARYLLDRIRLTKETESVLGCRDQNGLTLLHLAVDFKKCSEEQVEFVKLLISHYPDALAMSSGEISKNGNPVSSTVGPTSSGSNQGRSRGSRLAQEQQPYSSGTRSLKSGAAPYKHFLESMEQALNSNDQPSQPRLIQARRRFSRQKGSFPTTGDRTPLQPNLHARKPPTLAEIAAAQRMADLLKLSCMRRFGRDRIKLKELLESQNQIHLDLNPRTRVTPQLLAYIATKKLEPFLQYVYIPNLRVVNVHNKELEQTAWWESTSRKDYAYIFDWLKRTVRVTKIVRVIVEDDPADFHSDEVIEHSLKGFDVEEWKWFKWDLCSDTVLAAAPNVRELNLYWSGNKAVLKSWAAEDGLVLLRQLETIYIMHPQSKESRGRTNSIMAKFKEDVNAAWKQKWNRQSPRPEPPEIRFLPFTSQGHLTQTLSEKELEEKGKKDRWLKCTESFAKMLKKWFNQQLSEKDADGKEVKLAQDKEIRVAIIDDGADIDSDDLAENVETGETFYDSHGQWPGYYQSSGGHGHLMARLIRDLCPRVRLYIAKLNELWIDGRARITAESAAEAIEWARSEQVDIISMSWTIETIDGPAKLSLENAVKAAFDAGILLFCACDGQGNLGELPYPAKNNEKYVLKIGSANTLGIRDEGTKETFFDYIAPGLEEGRHGSDESGVVLPGKPLFGSSIATARCAGLAALILQCIVLVYHPDDWHKREVRKIDHMRKMFDRMVEKQDKNNYIKVWNVFEQAMNQSSGLGDDLEGGIIKTVAGEFIKMLEWRQLPMGQPCITVEPRVRGVPGPAFVLHPPPPGTSHAWEEVTV